MSAASATARRVRPNTGHALGARCSPRGGVLSRTDSYRYRRSLRPCLGTTSAPRERAAFRQTLLDRGSRRGAPPLARHAAGEDLPLPPPRAEAARDEHAVDRLELGLRLLERHPLGIEPAHAHRAAVMDAGVLERLVHGEVGVLELDVLADERDLDLARPFGADPLGQ